MSGVRDRQGGNRASRAMLLLGIAMRFVAVVPCVYLAILGVVNGNVALVVVGLLLVAGTSTYAFIRWHGYQTSRRRDDRQSHH